MGVIFRSVFTFQSMTWEYFTDDKITNTERPVLGDTEVAASMRSMWL